MKLLLISAVIFVVKLFLAQTTGLDDILKSLDTPLVVLVLGWMLKKQMEINESLRKECNELTKLIINKLTLVINYKKDITNAFSEKT